MFLISLERQLEDWEEILEIPVFRNITMRAGLDIISEGASSHVYIITIAFRYDKDSDFM